ncbi:PTS lactose/cellobiose transporter subunit IIA [Thermoflavimicrobium dichotomicum]|uniref:PTS system, cellobiose-specific IIA component n=1 Tax=Thermoflavimicrobium dichotomicum TaxID=46223 RepID=A0A1I3UYZ3_9BACL|nr:PTS lactose/cellobiose transporter subunit IIA [Thermoflavimicrobium dichotomicum]SFJ88122.1 PTS system, cellobiose-specific IIA component [Thermoflavimicrobium dichotomicum]
MSNSLNLENEIFLIISHGGNAKSLAYEALDAAENNDFSKADELLKQADEELGKAHQTQTKLIQAELNGSPIEKSLLLIHAQDHLMTAISEKNLIERLIRILKKQQP